MHKNAMRRRRIAVGKRLRDCLFIGAARREVSPAGDERGRAFVYVTNNPSVNSLCSLPPPFTQGRLLSGANAPQGRATSPRLHDVLPALRAWDIPPSPRRSRPTQGRAASPVSATLSHGTRPCDIPHIIHPYNTIRPLYLARPRRRHYSQNPPRNHANPTLAPPRSPLKNPRRAYIFAILY